MLAARRGSQERQGRSVQPALQPPSLSSSCHQHLPSTRSNLAQVKSARGAITPPDCGTDTPEEKDKYLVTTAVR